MRITTASIVLAGMALAACSSAAFAPTVPASLAALPTGESTADTAAKTTHSVFWSLFASCSYPQVQFAKVPLTAKATAKNVYCSSKNGLSYSSAMHVDSSGRLWLLNFGAHSGDPGSAFVFKLPFLSTAPTPLYEFVLLGTSDPDHLTFDASGNLWVSSHNAGVTEYKAPFKKSGSLTPALSLTKGIHRPAGIAVDTAGNVYVSNFASTGKKSIAVFKKPVQTSPKYYLNGLTQPGGLAFDANGDLYASINGPSTYAIVRYDSSHLGSGDKPSIVDMSGLPGQTYESDFAFSPAGDLYFANCGNTGSLYVYPTSTKAFSSTLAPSLDYTDADLQQAGCAWGIAIK